MGAVTTLDQLNTIHLDSKDHPTQVCVNGVLPQGSEGNALSNLQLQLIKELNRPFKQLDLSFLENLAPFYEQYFSFLNILTQCASVPELLYEKIQDYLNNFQKMLETQLEKIANKDDEFSFQGALKIPVALILEEKLHGSKRAEIINQLSRVEYLLHHLTRVMLLSHIGFLSVLLEKSGDKVIQKYEQILKAQKSWMQFINAVESVYSVGHPAVLKRAQLLGHVYYAIESQLFKSREHCASMMLSRLEEKAQGFVDFSKKLIQEAKLELEDKDVKQALQLFKESMLGVKNILMTPEQEKIYDRLHQERQKHKKLIQRSLLLFFPQSVKRRFAEFKEQYQTHQLRQDNSISDDLNLLRADEGLSMTLDCWGGFIQTWKVDPGSYASYKRDFETGEHLSFYFLNVLYRVYKGLSKNITFKDTASESMRSDQKTILSVLMTLNQKLSLLEGMHRVICSQPFSDSNRAYLTHERLTHLKNSLEKSHAWHQSSKTKLTKRIYLREVIGIVSFCNVLDIPFLRKIEDLYSAYRDIAENKAPSQDATPGVCMR